MFYGNHGNQVVYCSQVLQINVLYKESRQISSYQDFLFINKYYFQKLPRAAHWAQVGCMGRKLWGLL
jgi:hypothetical protein